MKRETIGNILGLMGQQFTFEGGKAMTVEAIEREIEKLPKSDKCILVTHGMFDLCRELLDEKTYRDQIKVTVSALTLFTDE